MEKTKKNRTPKNEFEVRLTPITQSIVSPSLISQERLRECHQQKLPRMAYWL